MTDILAGVRPCNVSAKPVQHGAMVVGNSVMMERRIARAHQPDALSASIAGRSLGVTGDIQELYNRAAAAEQAIKMMGQPPKVSATVPNIEDSRLPFGGDSLGNVLARAGLTPDEVRDNSQRLRSMIPVLPELRRALLAASGSTRKAAYRGAVASVQAVLDELLTWEDAVMASAEQEPILRKYEAVKAAHAHELQQAKDALARLPVERVESYINAVSNAVTSDKLDKLTAATTKKAAK